jgi:predicted SnoaL-like aldol condensation-catalyzing enzyme
LAGPDQIALLADEDPAIAANKQMAFAALRDLFASGGEARAVDYLAADFVSHDANGFAGRETFPSGADPLTIGAPLVAVVAQGDLVVLVSARTLAHPQIAGRTYTTTRFDMFRIANGRIAEHWSGATRPGQAPFNSGADQ